VVGSVLSLGSQPGVGNGNPMVIHNREDARDLDLVRRVVEGDQVAFRTLYQRYGPSSKGLALRVARSPAMAEEIVQEAFLALWRNPEAYREDRGSFRSWLMSTVHHRAVDAVRREETQRRRMQEAEMEAAAVQPDIGEAVVEDAEVTEARGRVRAALGEIAAEQRQILEMMYFGGKTQAAIADELALPLGTVKSRTLLGMRRLRSMLVETTP
jgi:RNA polymerase sigma factor (sigma-70 family)